MKRTANDYEIYFDGLQVNMKWVKENYGEAYAADLKKEIQEVPDYTTITDASGMLEVYC